MPRLDNLTPFAATSLPSQDFDGQRLVVVVVAGRFSLPEPHHGASHEPAIVDDQRPVPLVDEYRGAPGASSLRLEGQGAHVRLGTDIYVEGQAWAPRGRPAEHGTVEITIGACQKSAVVFGERVWRAGVGGLSPSRPEPFTSIPLVYERCFGGSPADATGSAAQASERNPVGCGLYVRSRDALDRPLPNIEDPLALLGSLADHPLPAGFGPIARHWRPRRDHAGTYDETWQRLRAPLWPRDVDPRIMNAAAPGL